VDHSFRAFCVSVVLLMLSACSGASLYPAVQAPPAPPPAPTETMPPQPSVSYVWIPGGYIWQPSTRTYLWVPGHWTVPPTGQVWVPGHWETTPTGHVWVDGRWRPG
jgi:WXXGXW repeat (2 copies)